jgi:asparagine synthase (glutamine-hydrolysing)
VCGLFGIVALDGRGVAIADARAARDTLAHRGPDQAGEWVGGSVYMGHRRLSILDLSENGRQPMVGADGTVAISVNGEIYNFAHLRSELETAGDLFRSASDSEVVLHGYLRWGLDRLLERLDGMYTIAIADLRQGVLHLARDRVGIKPLYYSHWKGRFAWASEAAAILHSRQDAPPAIDATALHDFLTYRYIPAPKTAWRDVFKLPPAHLLTLRLSDGGMSARRYWRLPVDDAPIDDNVAAEKLRALMATSVAEQRVADVPLGLFLSGGLDSSIIAAQSAAGGEPPETFTIGFGIASFDETPQAAEVARHVGARHNAGIISPHLDVALSEWLLDLFDEPFADDSALPTWHVARYARSRVTVALSGDGGDELFGGYRWYGELARRERWIRLLARAPEAMWRSLTSSRIATIARCVAAVRADSTPLSVMNALYISRTGVVARELWRHKLEISTDYDDMWFLRGAWRPEIGPRKALQYLDFHSFLPEDVLTKVDRVTMAHGLEARVPFLSRDLVEFAFQLPESFLYRGGELKGGLKYAFRDMLPSSVLSRPKRGFGVPWRAWSGALIGNEQSLQQAVLSRFVDTALDPVADTTRIEDKGDCHVVV